MKNITVNHSNTSVSPAIAVLATKDNLPNIPLSSFEGEYLQTALIPTNEITTLYVGLGDISKLNNLSYKEIGGKIASTFKAEKIYNFAVDLAPLNVDDSLVVNLTQGLALGTYSFSLKSEKKADPTWEITLVSDKANNSAIAEGLVLAEGVTFARNMTNMPANLLRPADFAKQITDLLSPVGVECEVISGDELKEKGLNGIYLVGNSSEFPPQMVIMRYNGGNNEKTALVGKGITYDTGGYNLKPSSSMETMQGDMAGAAAVTAAIYALAKNKSKANVIGVVALAENRISSGSLVAGDVYTSYEGQTVEVLNTDAEGRLVLSDAVAYAAIDEKADRILDVATLTGAVVRALGSSVTGVVSNDEEIWADLEGASQLSGERYWQFPTYEEYHKMIDSKIADVKNVGGAEGGSITGGLFIGRFVKDKPWIHLDIAGTSWVDKPVFAYQSAGATGTAVDTIYYFANK